LLQREHRGLERPLQRWEVEPLLADPAPMRLAPVLTAEVGAAVASQKLQNAMPPAEHIAPDIVAAADEITHSFFALVGNADGGEFAGTEQTRELGRVAAIGLDPLPGPSWRERWRDHRTGDTERSDPTVEIIAGDPGFVARGLRA
jgi:hypothetical protein